jgi:transcriptional regulator with XRE-family HTH domain
MERRMEDGGLGVELLDVNLGAGGATLVERFVILRRRLGITQAEVAARAGRLQQSHVSAWERGNRRLSDDAVARLVGALNEVAREEWGEEAAEAGSETTEQVA